MIFKIPFTFSNIERLKKRAKPLIPLFKHKKDSNLAENLRGSDIPVTREEYLAICLRSCLIIFVSCYVLFSTIFFIANIRLFFLIAIPIALAVSAFAFLSQVLYPKVYSSRKEKEIEKNLIPALEDILVQLNSGIPLFTILVNISSSEYGELSSEFKKVVRKINSGMPQIEVLEELGEKNSSIYFRRTLWQISNGMRAGSDISIIIKESIKSLNEEQLIQIQSYGNKLNPIVMFYMLSSVILPALAITFFTIIASLMSLPSPVIKMLMIGLFAVVVFIQIMFIGTIRSLRPTLL